MPCSKNKFSNYGFTYQIKVNLEHALFNKPVFCHVQVTNIFETWG